LFNVVMVFSKKFDMRQQPEMPDGVNLKPIRPSFGIIACLTSP